jgi:membrane protease YdiL (CAAX protease family)
VSSGLRRFLRFAFVFGLVAALGVLATPPVHRWLVDAGLLAEEKFPKVLRRLLLIPLLLVLFAFLRPWRDGRLASYGLRGPRARPGPLVTGFAVTALLFVALLAWQFGAGWLRWESPIQWGRAMWKVGRWIVGGLLIAVLEEWFFRGWMFRRFRRGMPTLPAVLVVAAVFALLHAFKPSHLGKDVTHDVEGALDALGTWFTHLIDPASFGPTFLGLFLFGLVLSGAYRSTGTLWASVGIHAAGVWVLRTHEHFTDRWPLRNWAGSKDLYDGWPAWVVLALAGLWLWTRPARWTEPDPDPRPPPSL